MPWSGAKFPLPAALRLAGVGLLLYCVPLDGAKGPVSEAADVGEDGGEASDEDGGVGDDAADADEPVGPIGGGGSSQPGLFEHSDVKEFYPETFMATVPKGAQAWVIDFYASWCPHCQHYAPTYKAVAAKFKGEPGVRLGALDCADYTEFCDSEFGVFQYPTVKAFHFGPNVTEEISERVYAGYELHREDFQRQEMLVQWIEKWLGNGSAAGRASSPAHLDASATSVAVAALPEGAAPGADPAKAAAVAPITEAGQSFADASKSSGAFSAGQAASAFVADAEIALLYSLHQGTFLHHGSSSRGAARASGAILEGAPLAEFCKWLSFLSVLFPTQRARYDVSVLMSVACAAAQRGILRSEEWLETLNTRGIGGAPPQAGKDPKPFWRTCKSYTCGLWRLFHVALAAVAEQSHVASKAQFLAASQALPPLQALERIRGFVANFFGCAACASHFLILFDGCELDRCSLERGDGRGAALWLWRVHNNVTQRIAMENGQALQPAWPPRSACPGCWPASGGDRWNSSAVYAFLRQTYLQQPWEPMEGLDIQFLPMLGLVEELDIQFLAVLPALGLLGVCAWRARIHGGRLCTKQHTKGN